MEGLKEQIRTEFLARAMTTCINTDEFVAEILALFQAYLKEKLEGLEVIGVDKKDQVINMATKLIDPMPLLEVMKFGDAVAQAQLEDVKKQLRDIWREK